MSDLTSVDFDLSGHEQARLAATLTACADDLDLVDVFAKECAAARMLYSNLSPEQQRVYAQLEAAGILGSV